MCLAEWATSPRRENTHDATLCVANPIGRWRINSLLQHASLLSGASRRGYMLNDTSSLSDMNELEDTDRNYFLCVCVVWVEKVESAELMKPVLVKAAKYSSIICSDSLCSMVLLLKNTLIILSSHTLTFTVPRVKSGTEGRWFGKLGRPGGGERGWMEPQFDKRREGCFTEKLLLPKSIINW